MKNKKPNKTQLKFPIGSRVKILKSSVNYAHRAVGTVLSYIEGGFEVEIEVVVWRSYGQDPDAKAEKVSVWAEKVELFSPTPVP